MSILFDLQLENLTIEGEPEGSQEFSLEIAAGETAYKILRPLQRELGSGLQMRYSYTLNMPTIDD